MARHWTPKGIPYPDKNEKMVTIPTYFADMDSTFRILAGRNAAGGVDYTVGSGTTDGNGNLSVPFARLATVNGMVVQGRGVGSLLWHWQWQASPGVGLAKLVHPPGMTPRPNTYVNYYAIGWGVSK